METSNFVVGLGGLVMVAGTFALATPASGYSSPECRVNCSGEPTPPQSSLIISQEETENEGEGAPAQFDPGEETGMKGNCLVAEGGKCPDGNYKCEVNGVKTCNCPPIGGYTIPQRLIEQSLAQSQDPEVPAGDPIDEIGEEGYAPPQRRA